MAESSSPSSQLMPGPQGKIPRRYQIDKGHKTDSYIAAVSGNTIPPSVSYKKSADRIGTVDEVDEGDQTVNPSRENVDGALSLQELEKYKNDPFWRTIRLILFLLFCLSWLLMFIAAILIVIFSPGCTVKTIPAWWQTAVSYQLWTPSFRDSDGDGLGDLAGLQQELENLRKSGIQVVWPIPLLPSPDFSLAPGNHYQVEPRLGNLADFDALIDAVHHRGMRLVLTLPISVTSKDHDWFTRSARATLPDNKNFSDFFHWSNISNSPAKFMSEERNTGVYYHHYEDKPQWPVLNWQSNNVKHKMLDVLSYWIDRGVDGFYLWGVEYLARRGTDHSTPDWPVINGFLRQIRQHVDTYQNETRMDKKKENIWLFASREEAHETDKKALAESGLNSVINYELASVQRSSKICHQRSEDTVAGCVHEILSDVLMFHSNNPNVWPMWELGNAQLSRLASRVESRIRAELLTMLQLMLPGTNTFYYGEELGMRNLPNDSMIHPARGAMQWDDSAYGGFSSASQQNQIPIHSDYKNINWAKQFGEPRSQLKMFIKLARLRKRDETLMVGQTFIGKRVGDGFTLTRFLYENGTKGQVYITGINLGNSAVALPLNDIPGVSTSDLRKSQVVAVSSTVTAFSPRDSIDLSAKILNLPAEQGLVIRFAAC